MYDISRTLGPDLAVWPGDQPFERDWTNEIGKGSLANVGRIRLSVHTGTHVDAPFHYLPGGETIDALPLAIFVGETLVIDVGDRTVITGDLLDALEDVPPRVLFRTSQSDVPDSVWRDDFPAVSPDMVDRLGELGVVLIGTDSPSVDPFDTSDLAIHHALSRRKIFILENLQLSGVEPGRYTLVAAPLKLDGMDGSPVRAILIR